MSNNTLLIIAIFMLLFLIYRKLKRDHFLRSLVGNKILLSYYDQNTQLEKILPRAGIVKSRHFTTKVNDWYLIKLYHPFYYNDTEHKYVLIRSKWAGSVIRPYKTCGVFVALIPNLESVNSKNINIKEFEQVAWAFAKII